MSEIIELADRRSDEWWSGPAVCIGCLLIYRAVVPLPCDPADLACCNCGERGDVRLIDFEMPGRFAVYDAPRADPYIEEVGIDPNGLEIVDE